MNRIKLFSHTDLDGYGCNIVAGSILKNVDCENLSYDNVNQRIKEFFINGEYKNYDKVYITDISVKEDTANIINNLTDIEVKLLDHHPTALWLNEYDWATVDIERDGEKISGTKMFYDELIDLAKVTEVNKNNIFEFVEMVRKYDTWLWKEKYHDDIPKKLNDLFYIYGYDRFADKVFNYLEFINNGINQFIKDNNLLLELEQEKIDRFVESMNKKIIPYNFAGYTAGVVFTDQYVSELGNRLSNMNPDYDLIIMIGGDSISYRTTKENIDCGQIAKLVGGGGHPKAAGSEISLENQLDYIEKLFKKKD
jgi:oligoribonuclease NrnB/cAMP/cGMP phosphodiesterase (DHH superfamily)